MISEHEKTQLTDEVQELCARAWGKGVLDGFLIAAAVAAIGWFAWTL
jgi:hypothetical protein